MKRLLLAALIASLPLHASSLRVLDQWVRPAPETYTFQHRPQESTRPIVVGDVLYYATLTGDVYAVHRKKNYIIWREKMPAGVEGALSYGRSKLFVGDVEGNLIAFYTRNGKEAWRTKTSSQWLSPPVQVGVRLFAVSSAGGVFAYHERYGKELWHFSQSGDEKMSIRGTAAPVVFGSDLYVGFADGSVVALGMENGKEKWSKRLSRRSRFYDVDTIGYADAKNLIFGTFDGSIYSLDRLTGDVQWRYPVGSHSGFYVSGDSLFFSGLDKHVYALNVITGKLLWRTPFEQGVGMRPIPIGDKLIIPTSSDPVLLLSQESGERVWEGRLGAGTLASATAAPDDWFYLLSNYGNLFAYQLQKFKYKKFETGILESPTTKEIVDTKRNRNAS